MDNKQLTDRDLHCIARFIQACFLNENVVYIANMLFRAQMNLKRHIKSHFLNGLVK